MSYAKINSVQMVQAVQGHICPASVGGYSDTVLRLDELEGSLLEWDGHGLRWMELGFRPVAPLSWKWASMYLG
jgi:hypothetical protein